MMKLRTTTLFVALFALPLGACDPATDADGASEIERGPIGKADAASGSCAAIDDDGPACGGPAPVGNCWCDEACADFGDCCIDAFDVCGVGEPQPAVSQCLSDAQCDPGQQCSGGVCVQVETCDDGSSLHPLCDIKPACDDGHVAAVIDGCFQCVDAITCEPATVPPPSCDDGSSLHPLCDIKPGCDDGQVAAIINSCFQCVDANTCEPS